MKKKLGLKFFTILASSFSIAPMSLGNPEIIKAINDVKITVRTSLNSVNNNLKHAITNSSNATRNQIVNNFDKTFNAEFDKFGNPVDTSSIIKLTDMIAKNFYNWYMSPTFPSNLSDMTKLNLKEKILSNEEGVSTLLSKDFNYNLLRNSSSKDSDLAALLSAKVEGGNNDIDSKALGLPANLADSNNTAFFMHSSIFPQGSFHTKVPGLVTVPNINDLIGADSYLEGSPGQNKAQLFISYLLKAVPPQDNLVIPEIPSQGTKNAKIRICSPKSSMSNGSCAMVKVDAGSGGSGYLTEYDRMVDYLRKNETYQKYKMAVRTSNILRSVYVEPLYRAYQTRIKKNEKENSLTEIEKYLVHEGLEEGYYEKLKNGSMADINVETLRAINKLIYLTHKVHKDNEQLKIIAAINSMITLKLASIQDGMAAKSVETLIKEECWKPENEDKDACLKPGIGGEIAKIQPK